MSPENPVQINQVSPIGGSLAGGYSVTIIGAEFEEGAVAYFGDLLAEKTTVKNSTTIEAVVPQTKDSGIVAVTVVNPDGNQFTLIDGFTYISMAKDNHAEVSGITPLTVIENIQTEVTLRGRNLIQAYGKGLVALRSPSRATINISQVTEEKDVESGIESLTFNVTISASPALGPKERIAIQVLASTRPESRNDLIVESSKQMFTVLPQDVPVPIAYTPNLSTDKPTMVVVLGRNLDGCSLEFGNGIQRHLQKSEEHSLVGLVTLSKNINISEISNLFTIVDKNGKEVEQYNLTLAASSDLKQSDPLPPDEPLLFEGASVPTAQYPTMGFTTDLAPIENQQFFGPTAEDSKLYYLNGDVQTHPGYDLSNFTFQVFSYAIRIPIIRRVYLFPMFDGGGEELGSEIFTKVGELFPVRGTGILFAARIEITIIVTVIVIITVDFPWLTGGFNEFPEEAPGAMLTIITGVIIEIDIIIEISFLTALVLPNGTLRLLFVFNLTINIDFRISTDGRHLSFVRNYDHKVNYYNIFSYTDAFPCGGRFQLAEENGQTLFIDQFGGRQSFYFARSAGECCVSWRFNLELVRFSSGSGEEVVQPPFDANMCITAEQNANLMDIIITSEPPPQGIPPTLTMEIQDSAILKALAQPVDENGNPNGTLRDVRDLGYNVEFYLDLPPVLLDPSALPNGSAFAIQPGQNIIRASISGRRQGFADTHFTFFPSTILGFDILRFVSTGQPPRVKTNGALPLQVNQVATTVTVETVLAYEDTQNNPPTLVAVPTIPNVLHPPTDVWEAERYQPFEIQREYVLAVKVNAPPATRFPLTLNFTVSPAQLKLFADNDTTALGGAILDPGIFGTGRGSNNPSATDFFTGRLVEATSSTPVTASLLLTTRPSPSQLLKVPVLVIRPNNKNENETASPKILIPPGKKVNQLKAAPPASTIPPKNVLLTIPIRCTANTRKVSVSLQKPSLNLTVRNDESFEEYLRVFKPVQTILTDAGTYFSGFAESLFNALKNRGGTSIDDVLINQGRLLWERAISDAQTTQDDRPLYWARLQGIGVIRAFAKRNNITDANLINGYIKKFENLSRGLDVDGSIRFTAAPAGARRAVVTGFDPFQLIQGIDLGTPIPRSDRAERSNPSGIIALYFDKKTIVSTDEGAVYIRTAILPVRYTDFNEGIVETAVTSSFGSLAMIITVSQNGDAEYYDVERWAARNRVNGGDNDRVQGRYTLVIPSGDEYLESTLPYEQVITTAESLTSPFGIAPFVIDQSFKSTGSIGIRYYKRVSGIPPTASSNTFFPEPLLNDLDGHQKVTDPSKLPTGASDEGSGGNYLSNEIFYRVAIVRKNARANNTLPGLVTGHFHVPPIDYKPRSGTGTRLITGVSNALRRLLLKGYRFIGSPVPFDFPATVINTTSAPKILTVSNNSSETLRIGSVEIAAPFSVSLPSPSPLPITVAPGASTTLPFVFSPTSIGIQNGKMLLKETSGEVLLALNFSGMGLQNQPPPIISAISPTVVTRGDMVTVTGQNLAQTTQVKIGNTVVNFSVISDTEIEIEATALSGFITVVTPFGTVTSSNRVTIMFSPRP